MNTTPEGVARAGRRGRRHRAVELPVRGHHQQARAGAGNRQHRRARSPRPNTPFNATRLGRLIAEKTDIPAGVVNVVTASDHFVGEELTLSPKVDMISFTGSTVVGKRIMEKGAATMKRLFLELGGKSATIVLEDADFDTALPDRHRRRCMHAGQGCAAPTRMLLPRSRYDEGVAILQGHLREHRRRRPAGSRHPVRPGDLGQAAQPHPRLHPEGRRRGRDDARRRRRGARRSSTRDSASSPTLFVDVDNSMTIAQEEIFGPVLVVIPYEDEDDAVRIANDSPYGLAGNVMSELAGPLAGRRPAAARRASSASTAPPATAPTRRSAATRTAASDARTASRVSSQYTEVKSVAYPAQ